ncbi:transcriptional regulator [Brevibacillus fluminis]|uniref:Transcriptional regulator n=1 Tax=Brevibacillus fluminis TaxID=511487 RepID=A0A3M8DTL0_9BACL|nr:FmdB family zinc ribbon protein [Brevibacillus fluminis]RNB91422.1 transcriptional regulator [Brevibacillus fluminis]
MPRYEYLCEECGPFIRWMSMSEVTTHVGCPVCEQSARRMFSAPGLIMTPQAVRQRIERGVEPKIVKKDAHAHDGSSCHGHTHGKANHTHHHAAKRPWMVGH